MEEPRSIEARREIASRFAAMLLRLYAHEEQFTVTVMDDDEELVMDELVRRGRFAVWNPHARTITVRTKPEEGPVTLR